MYTITNKIQLHIVNLLSSFARCDVASHNYRQINTKYYLAAGDFQFSLSFQNDFPTGTKAKFQLQMLEQKCSNFRDLRRQKSSPMIIFKSLYVSISSHALQQYLLDFDRKLNIPARC